MRSETGSTRIIACEVMKEELLAVPLLREVEFEFVSMGLHRWPDKLHEELRRLLAGTDGLRRVVLAFGLCGGAVSGLAAPSAELHIPLAHDCIPLLLGSGYSHQSLLQEEKGTFFLSGGWLEGERTVFSEYRRVRDKYGEVKARRVMATMFDAYRRLVFIRTGHPREEQHAATGRELASLLGLQYREVGGRAAWLHRIVNGPWDDEAFVTVAPGEPLTEAAFGIAAGVATLQGV
ncbi:DUF1638 domain-containing protein [Geomonas subterranea]|uniref:DUF1638 domain-containing protein n=1 Tax=Geomonas subterranea TaxID=2847989 RepID=A0ABX8LHA0_9BACT|nr:DUF1638 domain-containing protein [Geomonas subterranea]QXE91398.1 DUF1638 domain-containing protein [Geomonas subterranea]QXM10514.1 DUF1638 domain-containing protein [Geomonas subterranea]